MSRLRNSQLSSYAIHYQHCLNHNSIIQYYNPRMSSSILLINHMISLDYRPINQHINNNNPII